MSSTDPLFAQIADVWMTTLLQGLLLFIVFIFIYNYTTSLSIYVYTGFGAALKEITKIVIFLRYNVVMPL